MDSTAQHTPAEDKPTAKDYIEVLIFLVVVGGIIGKALHLY